MKREKILIKGAFSYLLDLYTRFKLEIMEYNEKIKSTGYYIKLMHVVHKNSSEARLKYVYFGRYWYRVSKKEKGVSWIYLGREKPEPSLPEPPLNPFEGVSVVVLNDEDIEVDVETIHLLARIEQALNRPGVFTKLSTEVLGIE